MIADSADELGRMGIIDILVNVIHNEHLNTEDKIKVTITLGHAIENSGDALNIYIDNFVHNLDCNWMHGSFSLLLSYHIDKLMNKLICVNICNLDFF